MIQLTQQQLVDLVVDKIRHRGDYKLILLGPQKTLARGLVTFSNRPHSVGFRDSDGTPIVASFETTIEYVESGKGPTKQVEFLVATHDYISDSVPFVSKGTFIIDSNGGYWDNVNSWNEFEFQLKELLFSKETDFLSVESPSTKICQRHFQKHRKLSTNYLLIG